MARISLRTVRCPVAFLIGMLWACPVPAAAGEGDAYGFREDEILALADRVFEFTIREPNPPTDRNWIRGTFYSGVMELHHATGNPKYREQAQRWGEKHHWQVGTERSGFNRLFCAMTWAELYLLDPAPERIAPTLEALAADVPYAPGGAKVWYGHAPAPHDGPLYADSLYGAPVLAMLARATGDRKYAEILHHAFWDVTDALLDRDENLYYRDPSYISQTSPNGGKILWSRGNGWVFGALPRILKYLPEDDPLYPRYADLYRRMAEALAVRQGDDGFWRSNLGDPWHYVMPETSGTAFFTAGFAWGVREGILDRAAYLPVVIRGWHALAGAVRPDGLLGWVQPVDAAPRPSHPRTSREYAVGPFLHAAGQVALLVRDGVIDPAAVHAALPRTSAMLPAAALRAGPIAERDHPLSAQINAFLQQETLVDFAPTRPGKEAYLDVIAGQVRAMRPYLSPEGRVIDPVEGTEKFFATPCYAHCVALLTHAGYPLDDDTRESGMRALEASLADLAAAKAPGAHGDFFTRPLVLAYELFDGFAAAPRRDALLRLLGEIDPARAYRAYRAPLDPADHTAFYRAFGAGSAGNWNLVNTAGEWDRIRHGLGDLRYVDDCLTMQLPNFCPYGMYNETGDPLPYDLFARHYVAGMLRRGYRSFLYETYRDILWRGAWTSLFMQSPFGELPTGYRSSHHIWNEAQQAVVFEIYASAYAEEGRAVEAGAFKRAARLSLSSIRQWIRSDGSGFIVKNRFPIEAKHGYESYSAHTCYNMLAMSMLAQAWQFADDRIPEKPCPAEVGGFAFAVPRFHKLFANAAGNFLEYDTAGDLIYNPTGLLRVHLRGADPQTGPSDGCAAKYSGSGNLFAVGPEWTDPAGNRVRLAGLGSREPSVQVTESAPDRVTVRVVHRIEDARRGTGIPVTPENTVAADGISPWFAEEAVSGKWRRRVFNDLAIYEVLSREGTGSGGDLKTTLRGLEPGRDYAVWVLNGIREAEGWQVLCGLTPDRTAAVLSRGMAERTARVTRRSLYHPLVHEGQALLGTARAGTDGTIAVYTFIPDDLTVQRRCWLAGFSVAPAGTVEEEPGRDGIVEVTETFTVTPDAVLVENAVEGAGVSDLRVWYPVLLSDGNEDTRVELDGSSVRVTLRGKGIRVDMLSPSQNGPVRSGKRLGHRNGIVEPVYWDVDGLRAQYRIAPASAER